MEAEIASLTKQLAVVEARAALSRTPLRSNLPVGGPARRPIIPAVARIRWDDNGFGDEPDDRRQDGDEIDDVEAERRRRRYEIAVAKLRVDRTSKG